MRLGVPVHQTGDQDRTHRVGVRPALCVLCRYLHLLEVSRRRDAAISAFDRFLEAQDADLEPENAAAAAGFFGTATALANADATVDEESVVVVQLPAPPEPSPELCDLLAVLCPERPTTAASRFAFVRCRGVVRRRAGAGD